MATGEHFSFEATEWLDDDGTIWPISKTLCPADRERFWRAAARLGSWDHNAAEVAREAGVDLVATTPWAAPGIAARTQAGPSDE